MSVPPRDFQLVEEKGTQIEPYWLHSSGVCDMPDTALSGVNSFNLSSTRPPPSGTATAPLTDEIWGTEGSSTCPRSPWQLRWRQHCLKVSGACTPPPPRCAILPAPRSNEAQVCEAQVCVEAQSRGHVGREGGWVRLLRAECRGMSWHSPGRGGPGGILSSEREGVRAERL